MATAKKNTDVSLDYTVPDDEEWTPPCVGSVGSAPNLDSISAQIAENRQAFKEKRAIRALAVKCGFCGHYHKEMQPPVESLITGAHARSYYPSPVTEPPVDTELLAVAADAVTDNSNPPVEEDENLLGGLDSSSSLEGSNDNTNESGTNTGASSSSTG